MNNVEKIETINNNAWFTFLSKGSMTLIIPVITALASVSWLVLGDHFTALEDANKSAIVRVAALEAQGTGHGTMIQSHEFQLQQIAKTLDAAIPVALAAAEKLKRDEDRIDAMAMAMQDFRHNSETISAQLTSLALQIADIKARLPNREGRIGLEGSQTTQIDPLFGIPRLPRTSP